MNKFKITSLSLALLMAGTSVAGASAPNNNYKSENLKIKAERLHKKAEIVGEKSAISGKKIEEKAKILEKKAELLEQKGEIKGRDLLSKGSDIFNDVKKSDWYYGIVKELSNRGIIKGYEDGSFKPNAEISYAEFLTLLNNAIGEAQENGKIWYENTFKYLKDKNIISDIEDPNAPITRKEMSKYLSNAIENLKGVKKNINAPDLKDFDSIKEDYRDFVANVYNYGIIKGDELKNFNADKKLTRAEASQIIKNLENKFK